MLVELRSLDSIKPYTGNPRSNEAAIQAVANSIKAFGWRSAARLQADRSMDALEHIGTPAAKAHLEALSRGTPECLWTIQAQEALARMSGRKD